jgi:hypothetical protein
MGRKALEKGKEIRCRLHDETEKVTVQGRFVIIKTPSEKAAQLLAIQKMYLRPDPKKGPVRFA